MNFQIERLMGPWRRAVLAVAVIGAALATTATPSSAQTIHAILAGNTIDPDIGLGAQKNIDRMSQLVSEIGTLPGWKANIKVITDNTVPSFSCQSILNAYAAIAAGPNDLVVVYYAGHGFRFAEQTSPFPRLSCQLNLAKTPLLEDLATGLMARPHKPRMVIAIADACNVVAGKQPGTGPAAIDITRQAAFLKLFARTKGTLIMSGSSLDQYSFYLPTGGFFSSRLVDTLEDAFSTGAAASWDEIVNLASQPLPDIIYEGEVAKQKPQARSDLQPI